MTPADLARANAISFECKKNSLRQMQNGDWQVSFTVQGVDMDERITRAPMGTRFVAVLVEVGDDEQPVRKEVVPNPRLIPQQLDAQPQPKDKPAGAKQKQDWRDMLPSAQAAMLGDKTEFQVFLRFEHPDEWLESMASPAECIRLICGVQSRSDLNRDTNHRARVIWHNLQSEFDAWKMKERVVG